MAPNNGVANDFTIVKELGKGGFGTVYLAKHAQLKEVALKQVYFPSNGRPHRSKMSMDSNEVKIYNNAKNILEQLQSQTEKITLWRPKEFPTSIAKLMENGDLRIAPVNEEKCSEKFIRKKGSGGQISYRHIQGNSPAQDVRDDLTMGLINSVHQFMSDIENIWTKSKQTFPLVMRSNATSSFDNPAMPSKVHSAVVPENNNSRQPLISHAGSAPATYREPQRFPLAPVPQNRTTSDNYPYEFKVQPHDPRMVTIYNRNTGSNMRMSSNPSTPSGIIYQNVQNKTEARFDRSEIAGRNWEEQRMYQELMQRLRSSRG